MAMDKYFKEDGLDKQLLLKNILKNKDLEIDMLATSFNKFKLSINYCIQVLFFTWVDYVLNLGMCIYDN